MTVEFVEKNIPTDSKGMEMFKETAKNGKIDKERYQKILNTQKTEVLWNLFQMHMDISKRKFGDSMKIGKKIISDFLITLHEAYLQESDSSIPEIKDLSSFLIHLTENELLPFSKKELQYYLRKTEGISSDNGNIEKNVSELYDLISDFQKKLKNFQID